MPKFDGLSRFIIIFTHFKHAICRGMVCPFFQTSHVNVMNSPWTAVKRADRTKCLFDATSGSLNLWHPQGLRLEIANPLCLGMFKTFWNEILGEYKSSESCRWFSRSFKPVQRSWSWLNSALNKSEHDTADQIPCQTLTQSPAGFILNWSHSDYLGLCVTHLLVFIYYIL